MHWVEYGAYAGILGGAVYLLLLFTFRESFVGRNRVSWAVQLEMAVFMILLGLMNLKARSGGSSEYLGAVGWVWLVVIILTVLIGFKWH
ncbi:hypothetical protein [Thermococcus gorgonarius]|uniref:Uncharacterized protein n=1 Tax=Thermococcus gorgonarius TaxID=71997 RepID=A0A2Z2MF99_THEGO|nr:hypothetical protein [Thermococcus gorgonarius]ASJ01131.1 hypothetical protein A3K92_06365 [Thermococcus gorgonarius]